jgi:hypothetical protein
LGVSRASRFRASHTHTGTISIRCTSTAVDTRSVQFWFVAVHSLIAMIPPVLLAVIVQRSIA